MKSLFEVAPQTRRKKSPQNPLRSANKSTSKTRFRAPHSKGFSKRILNINYTRQESVNRMLDGMKKRRDRSKKAAVRKKPQRGGKSPAEDSAGGSKERKVSLKRRREERKQVPKVNLTLKNKAKKRTLNH